MAGSLTDEALREDSEEIRRIVSVLAHPLRMRLIVALDVESPLAAETIADRIGEPVHRVRRHLNALVAFGMVGVAGEESRRNTRRRYFALEHRPWIDADEDRLLGERDRRRHTVGAVRVIFDEATRAASNTRLAERSDRVVVNFPGRVDEQGWHELSELHHHLLDRTREVIEASRMRLAVSEEEGIGVVSQQILLEAPQHSPDPSP